MYNQATQDNIQLWFLVASLIAVPLMLLPKPLYEIYCHKTDYKKIEDKEIAEAGRLLSSDNFDGYSKSNNLINKGSNSSQLKDNSHAPDEIMVHQLIETI
jgi:hypothetical protein